MNVYLLHTWILLLAEYIADVATCFSEIYGCSPYITEVSTNDCRWRQPSLTLFCANKIGYIFLSGTLYKFYRVDRLNF